MFLKKSQAKLILIVVLTFLFGCSGAQKSTTNNNKKPTDSTLVSDSIKKTDIVIEEEVVEELDSLALAYPLKTKAQYNIAYMLPLFLDQYPNVSGNYKRFSQISLEYWWGAQLAFDTLKQIGFNATVNLIDTKNDTSVINNSLKNLADTPDLIFGPLFPNNISYLQPYVNGSHTNLISPLATIDECNGYSDRTIFSKPTVELLTKATTDLITKKYDSILPILIFCRAVSYEEKEANHLKALLSENENLSVTIKKINNNYIRKNELKGGLPDSAVVIICSDRESFVTSVIAELRRSLNPYKVVGREPWLDFQSMDTEAWARLDMHFICSEHIDYENPDLKKFIKIYRSKYNCEPSKYAISAYFETIYYGLYLNIYGTNFQRFKNEITFKLPHKNINLQQADSCKYFFNNEYKVLKFKNHLLIEAQ